MLLLFVINISVNTNCIKSPARKEIKIDYADQINREILQWKRLIEKQHTFNKELVDISLKLPNI